MGQKISKGISKKASKQLVQRKEIDLTRYIELDKDDGDERANKNSGFYKLMLSRNMIQAVLLPFLDLKDLVRFMSLNRMCRKMLSLHHKKCVHFDILFNPQTCKSSTMIFKPEFTYGTVSDEWT